MGFLFTFLFVCVIIWLLIRAARDWFVDYIASFTSGPRSPFDDDRSTGYGRHTAAHGGFGTPRRRKKIDAETGEYIDFEEVTVNREEELRAQYRIVEFQQQQQVSDAEWEEIE